MAAPAADDPDSDPIVNPDGTLAAPPASPYLRFTPAPGDGSADQDFSGGIGQPQPPPGAARTRGAADDPDKDPIIEQAGPPVPPPERGWLGLPKVAPADANAGERLLGAYGTGANMLLTGLPGAASDWVNWGLNKAVIGPAEAGARALGLGDANWQLPMTGRETLQGLIANTVGVTQPQNFGERMAARGGAATAALLPGFGAGKVLKAADVFPKLTEALTTPAVTPGTLPAATLATASGAGGVAGREGTAQLTTNPVAQEIGDFAGSFFGPAAATTALAPVKAVGSLANPFLPGAVDRAVQRLYATQPTGVAAAGNPAVTDDLATVGTPGDPTEISTRGAGLLEQTRAAQKDAASAPFEALPPTQTQLPVPTYLQRYSDYMDSLPVGDADLVPDTYRRLLNTIKTNFGDTAPLNQFQSVRQRIGDDQAAAYNAQDYNKARVLKGLQSAFGDPEDDLAPEDGPYGDAARAARAGWRDYASTYTDPKTAPTVTAILKPGGAPDSAAFTKLLGQSQAQTENVQQFLKAAQGDPATLQAGRDWVVSQIVKTARTGALDEQRNPILDGPKVQKFLDNNQPLIKSDLFSDDQRAALDRVASGASTAARLKAQGVPTTVPSPYQRGTADWKGAFGVSPGAAAAAGSGIGLGLGTLASHLTGLPWEEMAGAYLLGGGGAGHALGPNVLNWIYSSPRARLTQALTRAAADPNFAPAAVPPAPDLSPLQKAIAGTGFSVGGGAVPR